MGGIEGVIAGVSHDQLRIVADKAVPDESHAARVSFRSHKDDAYVRLPGGTRARSP